MHTSSTTPIRLADWLQSEPFTLGLSSGFFGFFAHAGFVSALEASNLLPARISGSSAGALVAGVWASGRTMGELSESLFRLDRESFWDPGMGMGLLKGTRFAELLDDFLLAKTFETCRGPLTISVFDLKQMRTRVISEGDLIPAIRASCCFPGLFHPVRLDGRWSIDGGVLDRPGLAGVEKNERVLYHHLRSRSRLRGKLKRLSGVPSRNNMVTIQIANLPRLGPNRLGPGPEAFNQAYRQTMEALDRTTLPGCGFIDV